MSNHTAGDEISSAEIAGVEHAPVLRLPDWIGPRLQEMADELEPYEAQTTLEFCVFRDERTGAWFCECHVKASKLSSFSTTDVPLDPDEQAEYRANRNVVEDAYAFQVMKDDAKQGRTFSNIVAEYTKEYDVAHPLKIIGGQHRFLH